MVKPLVGTGGERGGIGVSTTSTDTPGWTSVETAWRVAGDTERTNVPYLGSGTFELLLMLALTSLVGRE